MADMDYLRIDRDGNLVEAKNVGHHRETKPTPPHHEWCPYVGPVIWTGPDGTRDHRPKLFPEWQYLGTGENSSEKSLSCTYISKATKDTPFPKPRSASMGEIGWFHKNFPQAITRTYPYYTPR